MTDHRDPWQVEEDAQDIRFANRFARLERRLGRVEAALLALAVASGLALIAVVLS